MDAGARHYAATTRANFTSLYAKAPARIAEEATRGSLWEIASVVADEHGDAHAAEMLYRVADTIAGRLPIGDVLDPTLHALMFAGDEGEGDEEGGEEGDGGARMAEAARRLRSIVDELEGAGKSRAWAWCEREWLVISSLAGSAGFLLGYALASGYLAG